MVHVRMPKLLRFEPKIFRFSRLGEGLLLETIHSIRTGRICVELLCGLSYLMCSTGLSYLIKLARQHKSNNNLACHLKLY